jgi:hypothetical protein
VTCRIACAAMMIRSMAASSAALRLAGGSSWSCCQATVCALIGRVAPRGGGDTEPGGKFGRAPVVGRVRFVVLSSNCCRFVWPHRSARHTKNAELRSRGKPRFGWRAVGSRLRLAAPPSAASDGPWSCRGWRRAWLAGGRTFGANWRSVVQDCVVRIPGRWQIKF